jgi:hypothetical protein
VGQRLNEHAEQPRERRQDRCSGSQEFPADPEQRTEHGGEDHDQQDLLQRGHSCQGTAMSLLIFSTDQVQISSTK